MSNSSAKSDVVVFIDSEASLLPLLGGIANLPVNPPSLYIDVKGIPLGSHDYISLFLMHVAPTKTTYLIDVHRLGEAAFSTPAKGGTSLRAVLESAAIPKVVFDIRNISAALFKFYQIYVDGIKDLQLMELAFRKESRRLVSGLAKCVERDSPISAATKAEWRTTNERGRKLCAPENGGRCKVFNDRPLSPEIIEYCKGDVSVLPVLFNVYNTKLRRDDQAFWRVHVRDVTSDRINLSQTPSYDGRSKSHAYGWDDLAIEKEMNAWNEEIMMEAMAGTHYLNEDDRWVPVPSDGLDEFCDEWDLRMHG